MRARNFKQAAQMSLDDRWNKIVKVKTCRDMLYFFIYSECELCKLRDRRNKKKYGVCRKCPVHDGDVCCKEYRAFIEAIEDYDNPKALEAAQGIVKRLEAIVNGTD